MTTYNRGQNPSSQKNLNRDGSEPRYEEKKKPRSLVATDTGWEGTKQIASKQFGLSVSELIDQIGRGRLVVSPVNSDEA